MKSLILTTILLSSIPALASSSDRFAEDRMDDAQTEMVKQRLETVQKQQARPSSTAIGGSRSGQLEFEKRQDMDQMKQEQEEESRDLYEADGRYRTGF